MMRFNSMLTRHQQLYTQILQVMDAITVCFAFWVAHVIRLQVGNMLPFLDATEISPFSNYIWLTMLLLPLSPLVLESNGFYRFQLARRNLDTLMSILRSILFILAVLLLVLFVFRIPQEYISRGVFLLFVPISTLFLFVRDLAFRGWLLSQGRDLSSRRHIILCGTPKERVIWHRHIQEIPGQPYVVVAEIDLTEETLRRYIEILHDKNIDISLFCWEDTPHNLIRDALTACEIEGIEGWVTATFFQTTIARPIFDHFQGRPLLVFRSTPDASVQLLAKDVLDRVVGSLLLLLALPVLLICALIVWRSSGLPVFFHQRRSGLNGRPFTMYKFRTMVNNAEQKKLELQAFNQMSGPVFKMENDPRVTSIGRWLRKTSIDELPQLWNVVRGDMSLVGPRPLPIQETEKFDDLAQRRRMSVRPGITCLWQISGRNSITDFKDWVRLDLEYIDNWSFWLDIKILLMTVPVVFFGRGAK
jgi:exopolysaccharide biosynthesis polyprenyl glycosylphosphotransferase